ncbi:metal ABC transporter ATP-binding protein [bacterium]|nr:metal ABC transporter ATP-binding protein [bacterium]
MMTNPDHSENIIEIRDLSYSYGETRVLRDIQLSIHRGDYLAIVGGNGAGKSTLLKIILGLLPIQDGSVRLFGQDIRSFRDWPKIAYVPQKATNFDTNFPATVREVVLMGRFGRRGILRRVIQEDHDAVQESLEQVGMWEYRDRQIGDLSGGQQQRIFIARALAGKPEIVFLDEPTVGVETHVRDEFYALLRKMNERMGLTVVLITHDIEKVGHEAMHVACIDRTLFYHASVDDYFKHTHIIPHPHT